MGTRLTWGLYLVLFALSVPWYFPAGSGEPLLGGFPLWCAVSVACYVAVAILTIVRVDALWRAQVDDGEDSAEA